MHLSTAAYFLAPALALAQSYPRGTPARSVNAPAAPQLAAGENHWCGKWAGVPNARDVPFGQQLPVNDFTRRLFVEPQLQNTPFSPIIGAEPKVQIPKIWGNNRFRLALLSYATDIPAPRIYSSSKSRWADFHEAIQLLMAQCVEKGSGGAYLVPPSPGLTQGTLVLYAYEVGSKFDFQMNYYMSQAEGINPARLADDMSLAMLPVNETGVAQVEVV